MDINAVHLFRQIPTIKLKFTCPGFALLHIDNGFPDPLKDRSRLQRFFRDLKRFWQPVLKLSLVCLAL